MRSRVLNIGKSRRSLRFTIKVIALILLLLSAIKIATDVYISSDAYIDAMINETERKLIIIDAGHGGEDSGTVSKSGIKEKDLNLEMAFAVGAELASRGYPVIYTRSDDKLLYTKDEDIKGIRKISDLKNRCKIAAEYPNALFVSIHMNSYPNPKYQGLQVYYSQKNEGSSNLAHKIQMSVKNSVQPDNERKIKPGKDIFLLENTDNTAVLVECGFLSNPSEAEKLSKKEYQKQLSLAIVCGIIEYKDGDIQQKGVDSLSEK